MDQNWNGAVPQNQSGGNGQMGPNMPPVPNAGMNTTPMLTPQMPAGGAPVNPMAPPMPDSGKKGSIVETIILGFVCLIAAGAIVAAVMFYMKYDELETNFDIKVSDATSAAKKEQSDLDEKKFTEREKTPTKQFTGPSDYGSISFYYPKTWSVYVDSDGTNNSNFVAYFAPEQVNPLKDKDSRYALRFTIMNKQSEDVMKSYDNQVKKNELKASVFNADDMRISGTLYEGQINKTMRGIVLVVKVNNMTAILQTDAEVYRADFEALIATLRRNS
jgi:hypothetical protein